jgi:hypothetical protein
MVALHLFCMPLMILFILYCGMAFHSMMIAFSNILKRVERMMLALNSSQICLIGARSGERLDQGNVLTSLACKKLMERRAVSD